MKPNTSALFSVTTEPIAGKFYRYIKTKYANQPLSMFGALTEGRRYNVKNLFGALYLGFDRKTCEAEVSQGIAAGLPFKKGAFTAWDYDVNLQAVVRLDNSAVQAAIGVTEAEITIKGDHTASSQIGEPLFNRGNVEGLVAPSAQLAGGKCLDVFLDHVKGPSHVTPLNNLDTWP